MRRLISGCCLIFWCGILGVAPLLAAKPGGGTPPAGQIYFQYQNLIRRMNADGSGKVSLALPTGLLASPSSLTYGGKQWWITVLPSVVDEGGNVQETEIFAYQEGNPTPVQVTDVGGEGFYFGWESLSVMPRWSNDGVDSFISVVAGVTPEYGYLCRLWIDGDDISAIAAGAPPLTSVDIELAMLIHADSPIFYAWSPDPNVLAYQRNGQVRVRVLGSDPESPVADTVIYTGALPGRTHLSWSPAGNLITFATSNTQAWGGTWTIKPDGTGLKQVKKNSGTMSYEPGGWSPNGAELLLWTVQDKGFGVWYYNLARMPAAGGTPTTLTNDLEQNRSTSPIGWLP